MSNTTARQHLNALAEHNADPVSLTAQLNLIIEMALQGVEQEKVSVKDGVLQVKEKELGTAVRAIALIHKITQDTIVLAAETPVMPPLTINVHKLYEEPE